MSVHYKFKNTKDYEAVKFDGVYISAADLKSIIAQQKKLGNSKLQVENEETKQLYTDEQLIPKNTHVIVIRTPLANSNKRIRGVASQQHHNNHHNNHHHNHHHQNNHRQVGSNSTLPSSSSSQQGASGGGREALELVSTKNMSEEEKIKYIQSQSTKDFDPTRYARGNRGAHRAGGRGRLFVPPGYTCRKCGIPGHSIYDCGMSSMHKVKRSSGIPRDFLMKVDSKEKGALMTPSGEYAVPYIDREAYSNPKVEKAPFFEDGTPSDDTIPS